MNGLTLANLLAMLQGGVAPMGLRYDTGMPKGMGYMGMLPATDGVATEISTEDSSGSYPLIVPTLTKKEVNHLLSGKRPTEEIYNKARMWADSRRKQGMNTFATPRDIRMPVGLLD
jgi:hypothetical protein